MVLAWNDYSDLSFTRLDEQLAQAPVSNASLPHVGLFVARPRRLAGHRGVGDRDEHRHLRGGCSRGRSARAVVAGRTAPPSGLAYVSLAAGPAEVGVLTVHDDGTVAFVRVPAPFPVDAGAVLAGARTVADAGPGRVPALASSPGGYLAAWWQRDYDQETVAAALISPGGNISPVSLLSQRATPHNDQRSTSKLRAAFDGVRYWVAYTAPLPTGGYDAYLVSIETDGGVGVERPLAVTGFDQEVQALVPGTVGRLLAVTRGYDSDAGRAAHDPEARRPGAARSCVLRARRVRRRHLQRGRVLDLEQRCRRARWRWRRCRWRRRGWLQRRRRGRAVALRRAR